MNESKRNRFERFSFSPAFEVVVDPEFPGSGTWPGPVYAYDSGGSIVDEFRSTWGTPFIVEVRPFDSEAWVGFFPSSGVGGASGTFAMPSPGDLCICAGGALFVVNVLHPELGVKASDDGVQDITASDSPPLLLTASFSELTAFDAAGVAWRSQLGIDDLRILGSRDEMIQVSVRRDFDMTEQTLDVDAYTGHLKDYDGL